jgi:uncharacterized protein YacL
MPGRKSEKGLPPSSVLSTCNKDRLVVSLISLLKSQLIGDQLIIKASTQSSVFEQFLHIFPRESVRLNCVGRIAKVVSLLLGMIMAVRLIMTMAMAMFVAVTVFVSVTIAVFMLVARARNQVDDHKRTTLLQPACKPLQCHIRMFEVVQRQAHGYDVKIIVLWSRKFLWSRLGKKVGLVPDHFVAESDGTCITVEFCHHLFGDINADHFRQKWCEGLLQ